MPDFTPVFCPRLLMSSSCPAETGWGFEEIDHQQAFALRLLQWCLGFAFEQTSFVPHKQLSPRFGIHAGLDPVHPEATNNLLLPPAIHYAPELNPNELVWSHMKRTGVSRTPLPKGEKLGEKIDAQLSAIKRMPSLVRAFFETSSVAYITD